ncbi:hypothetical protein PIROE2DRAFT_10552, partial [Piromyces sp. E2]
EIIDKKIDKSTENLLNSSHYLNYINELKNSDEKNEIINLYKAIHIVNLVRKDIESILNNTGEYQSVCSKEEYNKINVLYQIVTEISRTLKLAISRQQEVTDQILGNLEKNTSFFEEQEWNISFAKNGMELAEVVTKIHQYIYKILQRPKDLFQNSHNVTTVDDNIGNLPKDEIKKSHRSTFGTFNNVNLNSIEEVEDNDSILLNDSVNVYNKFNRDNINNIRFQSNIDNNNQKNKKVFNGWHSQKDSDINKLPQINNMPYLATKIGNIINPTDEINTIATQYQKNNNMVPNRFSSYKKSSPPSQLPSQNNKHLSLPPFPDKSKPKVASINMNINQSFDDNIHSTSFSVIEEKLLHSKDNNNIYYQNIDSTNHYYSLPYHSTANALLVNNNKNVNNNHSNNVNNNNNNNNNNNSNNSNNVNHNNYINNNGSNNNNTRASYQNGISTPENDESFINLLNSLNEPIKNLVISSELKVPSNVHNEILDQYEKVLSKNKEYAEMTRHDSHK